MRMVELLKNLAVAAAAVTVTAAALEGAARVHVARIEGGPGTVKDPLLEFDPHLGWSKPANGRAVIRRPEYEVELRINSRQLRGPERGHEKAPGTRRVLLLGDSFVEGYTVREPDTVRAALEQILATRGPAEVLNAGTHGYSTDQEYLYFVAEGRLYLPDDVVLFFYYNDLEGNVSDDGKPYFVVEEGRLALRNSPVPEPAGGDRLRQRPFRLRPFRGSMALRLLSNRTVAANPALHRALARVGLVEPEDRSVDPRQVWPFGPAHLREVDAMWEVTTALLRALDEEVRRAGGRLTVFYVPVRFEANDRAWELTRQRNGWGPRWKRERVVERLAATCGDLGLRFVDPRRAFRAAEEGGTELYLPQDGHWAAAGHRLAAERIADALR